jgi:hypothetical protein
MGSMISLGVGKLEVDWGKNNFFINHSKLFLPHDIKKIPYYYADNIVEYKEGYSRRLIESKRRLELLGYPLHALKSLYEFHLMSMPDYYAEVPITFEDFYDVLIALDIRKVDLDIEGGDYDLGEFVSQYLFKDPEFNKKLNLASLIDRDIGTIFENMDPYIILRILMENPANCDQELQWRYSDVLDGGWIGREEIYQPLTDSEKILIVTEGSSDSFVISRALEFLFPDIKDFFYFVDMEEHYPFTGTGNLHKFCQGLASIKIQNNVLVIYDNDVAGVTKYNLSYQLILPKNMKIIKLPEYKEFENFLTIGPNGQTSENINGRAVSIECFLDLTYKTYEPAYIRWTSYDANSGDYQGELINKEKYVRLFGGVRPDDSNYDFSKLTYFIDYLYNEWISITFN